MIVTEQEAKSKWCPYSRVGIHGGGAVAAVNRHPEESVEEDCRCRASACMLWQWVTDAEGDRTKSVVFPPLGKKITVTYEEALRLGMNESQAFAGRSFEITSGDDAFKRAVIYRAYRDHSGGQRFVDLIIDDPESENPRMGKCGAAPGGEHV